MVNILESFSRKISDCPTSEETSSATRARNRYETLTSASSGQLSNQSSVQQFTREGNFRHLIRRESLTGDMQRIMWKLSLTLSMKV